jgi:hypothetical protein
MRYWYDTDLAITGDDLSCPGYKFFNSLPLWLTFYPQFKITNIIIQSIAIFVVNVFIWVQRTPKVLLHNVAMLKYPLVFLAGFSLYSNSFVSILNILAFHRADTARFTRRTATRSISRITANSFATSIVYIAIAMYPYRAITALYWTSRLMWGFYSKPIHIASLAQFALDVLNFSFTPRRRTCFRCFRFALRRIVTSTKPHCGVSHGICTVFNDAFIHAVIIA